MGAPAAAPGQATPGGIGNKQISIEWWRRNYTPGSQNAETITSDAAVAAFRSRYANVSITIQGGPFGPETDQKFDIAILQQHAGPDVFHTTGGDVLKYAAAGQLAQPPFDDADRKDFNPSALQATTAAIPGATSGKMTCRRTWPEVAPSILAASSNSHGTPRKNVVSTTVANTTPTATSTVISLQAYSAIRARGT